MALSTRIIIHLPRPSLSLSDETLTAPVKWYGAPSAGEIESTCRSAILHALRANKMLDSAWLGGLGRPEWPLNFEMV